MKREILIEFDEYVEKSNAKEERKLTKQRREGLRECKQILKILNKRKRKFRKEIKYVNEKMMPYITRRKWMPYSFKRMISIWADK